GTQDIEFYIIYLIGHWNTRQPACSASPGASLLSHFDLTAFELADHLLEGIDELALFDAGLSEGEVQAEGAAPRLVDEGELSRAPVRARFLAAKVVSGGTVCDRPDRFLHFVGVLQAGDLQKHAARVDVGAPTFLPQPLGDFEKG